MVRPPRTPGKKMQEEANKNKGVKKNDMQKCHGTKKK